MSVAAVLAFHKYRSGTAAGGPKHSFAYWLTVQKVRDRKTYQNPFQSNGEETFESGDKFRLNVSSPDPGYLYVFNEGPPEPNDGSFKLIFPRPGINNGSATVGANQTVQSNWITFRGLAGDENLWIVWTASPVSQLESIKTQAFKHPRGGLNNENLIVVKEFLTRKNLELSMKVTHDKTSQTTLVRGAGEMLVTLSQFKHR
jgi:hypothetical protein